ncbi:MAG: rhodanese-like domain-containing protein [Proteobacteria bacterium]|nr:rhodanese-like domain-containing protein [Pseudomonadota bacterium]
MSDQGYAGDISPSQAWHMLRDDQAAELVDVRTDAEFSFVGLPDLKKLGKAVHRISWKIFPNMDRNPHFEDAVREAVLDKAAPILFLCRSGQRSQSAAIAMTALGYERCYNVSEGFEGDKDQTGRRGTVGGWKVHGLPWMQG